MKPLYFAPLQGYTDDAYRRIHHSTVGGAARYYTPFVRWEKGGVRSKDLRDLRPDFNVGVPIVPQIIAADVAEFRALLEVVTALGYTEVDLNMGCPFPLQARHGRGAGLMGNRAAVQAIVDEMTLRSDLRFSVKIRLGWDDASELAQLTPLLNVAPLTQVVLHPRLGVQGYKGEADRAAFAQFATTCRHPLVYNGDLRTPADIAEVVETFPQLSAVMVGRGWLARPSLGQEVATGRTWTHGERIELVKRLHDQLHAHYASVIPGESQLLMKLRTFWDFMEEELGRKAFKKVQKAGNLKNYLRAVDEIM